MGGYCGDLTGRNCAGIKCSDCPDNVEEESTKLSCGWSYSEGNEKWYTSCGENWTFLNDEMKFCFNCGKKIKDITKNKQEK